MRYDNLMRDDLCPGTSTRASSARVVELAELAEATVEDFGKAAAREIVISALIFSVVLDAVRDGDELTRRKALGLLHYWDPARAACELVTALHSDPCPVVRHEAAYYLATLKRPETIAALEAALRNDPIDLVRHEAAEALGDMGAASAIAALRAAMDDPSDVVARTARISIQQLAREVR